MGEHLVMCKSKAALFERYYLPLKCVQLCKWFYCREDFGKGVMFPGSEILTVGNGWYRDFQSLLFLFTQLQTEDSTDSSLSFLMVYLPELLCNPNNNNILTTKTIYYNKNDLLQIWHKLLALTSTTKRYALQLLGSMIILVAGLTQFFIMPYFHTLFTWKN